MKNTFTNLVLFAALTVAFSSLTACSTASTEKKGAVIEVAPNASNVAVASNGGAAAVDIKDSNFPPVPSGLYQAQIKDLEGNSYKLEDKKGKVVLVNLWAIWCGPCIAEMPHLREMQQKYREKNFEVLGLNTGDDSGETESVENIKAFVEDKKLNYPIGYADEKFFSEMLRVTRMGGIPQSILINRDGKMTGIFKGGGQRVINEMKQSVEKLMSE
jgi:thiol-disulfide isomerase/thioredoxin